MSKLLWQPSEDRIRNTNIYQFMKVINEKHVSGQNVELRVFNKSGEQRLKVHMGAAEYFVSKGVLLATEILTISGDGIKARGTGAIFHLDSRPA